jgi:Ran GTPase-activating protein (RanGAP) involved in mRNA processing and transport
MTRDEKAIETFGVGSQHVVEKGRVVECQLTARELLAEGPRLFQLGLTRVRLWDGLPADVEKLCALDGLAALRGLDFAEGMVTQKGARALAGCGALGQLERLSLQKGSIGEEGLEALLAAFPRLRSLALVHLRLPEGAGQRLAAAALPELRALDLAENQLGDAGAAALATLQAPLEKLVLAQNQVGDAGAAALAKAPFAATLGQLDLSNNRIGDDGVVALAGAFPKLTDLDLSGAKVGARGAAALANSVHRIDNLDLSMARLKPKEWAAFAASKATRDFDELSFSSTKLDDAGAAGLAGWAGLARCKTLDLGFNKLTHQGLKRLLARDLGQLKVLTLDHNPLGPDAGAVLGQAAGRLGGLERLTLRRCELDDAAAAGLISLAQLEWLSLEDEGLTDAACATLAASALRLQTLSLGCASVTAAGLKALLAGKGLAALAYLFVAESVIDPGDQAALQALAGKKGVTLTFR